MTQYVAGKFGGGGGSPTLPSNSAGANQGPSSVLSQSSSQGATGYTPSAAPGTFSGSTNTSTGVKSGNHTNTGTVGNNGNIANTDTGADVTTNSSTGGQTQGEDDTCEKD